MVDDVLYIIGNGFDRHHGVSSGYDSFRFWLRKHNLELFYLLQEFCNADFLWSEFERALGFMSREYFLSSGEILLPTDWDPDRDPYADLFLAEDFTRNSADMFWKDIQKSFRKWICSVQWHPQYSNRKVMLDTQARFITFNYTPFLETQYGIPEEQILYIHGKSYSKKNPPILGHDGSDHFEEDFQKMSKRRQAFYTGPDRYLPEIEFMTESAETFDEESCKPVGEILKKHQSFFEDLYDIKHVYVLGHSLGSVDLPYFRKVVACNDYPSEMCWHISYYSDNSKQMYEDIVRSQIAHPGSPVTSFRLEDILLKKK